MDPQNRILLEQSFMALSEAQAQIGELAETRTGVYVGCMYQEFTQLQYNLGYSISPAIATGNGISYLVGRISYAFGLQGPCASTDTACSSSLVALDMAHKVDHQPSCSGLHRHSFTDSPYLTHACHRYSWQIHELLEEEPTTTVPGES